MQKALQDAFLRTGAMAVLLGLTATACRRPSAGATPTLVDLVRAVGPVLIVGDGRLSEGFQHAASPRTADIGVLGPRSQPLAELMRGLRRRAYSLKQADSSHILATLDLLVGKYEAAAFRLREATTAPAPRADLLSDLSAAYLALAVIHHDPRDLVEALATADRAVTTDPASAPALFNRALALERLYLPDAARAAWRDYLQHDRTGSWANEAGARLRRLLASDFSGRWKGQEPRIEAAAIAGDLVQVRSGVRAFVQPVSTLVEEELLPEWADASVTGDSASAAHRLAVARPLASALAEVSGDELLAGAVAAIDAARGDPARQMDLATAHRDYRAARRAYLRHDIDTATTLFARARGRFERASSPLSLSCQYQLISCAYQRSNYRRALAAAEGLLRVRDLARQPTLQGRLLWLVGICRVTTGRPADALQAYRRALTHFEAAGRAEDTASLHSHIALDLGYLGLPREAWRDRLAALAGTEVTLAPHRLAFTWDEAASALEREDHAGVALYFRNQLIEMLRSRGDQLGISFALLSRAETCRLLGHTRQAREDLRAARTVPLTDVDRLIRRRQEAWIAAAEGFLDEKQYAQRALLDLGKALSFFQATGNHFTIATLLLARSGVYRTLRLPGPSARDLRAGIDEFERQRELIPDEAQRNSYFSQVRQFFDDMIVLRLSRGDGEGAFSFAEQARARNLLERVRPADVTPAGFRTNGREGHAGGRPLVARVLCSRLPRGMALIEYAVLEDRLMIWVARKGGVEAFESPITSERLSALVKQLRGALGTSAPISEIDAAAARVFDAVLRPALLHLRPDELLVLAPDRCLQGVPFGVLLDASSKRYLSDIHPLAVVPSGTFYIEAMTRWRRLARRDTGSALVVGDPAFDALQFPDMPRLASAAAEAQAVAALYPSARLIVGEQAMRSSVIAMAGNFPVVHLAAHTLVDEDFPMLSRIILAPDRATSASGVVYAYEVSRLWLRQTRLLVLAGCASGAGPTVGGEGIMSLARSFLEAGVPVLVASLWRIPDDATRNVMVAFHRQLRSGLDPASALRAVARELRHSANPELRSPRVWSAFVAIGGVPPMSPRNESLLGLRAHDGQHGRASSHRARPQGENMASVRLTQSMKPQLVQQLPDAGSSQERRK
jgi:CHAT domain-containing protein/tetratricopeptide (TPR) repeat protein